MKILSSLMFDGEAFVMSKFNDITNFLFADSDFLSGFGSVMDIGGTLVEYNSPLSGRDADRRAIVSDWAAIGEDFRLSIDKVEQEKGKS